MSIAVNLGLLLGYTLSSWMRYDLVPYVSITITCVFVVIFVWLPESSDFLAHKQLYKEAKKAYAFYGNSRVDSKGTTQDKDGRVTDLSTITWQDFKDKAVIKGLLISLYLIIATDTSGKVVLTSYITEIFEMASIKLDVYLATIVVGIIQVVGAIISSIFVDRFGRRFLLIGSCIGTAICFYALGLYFYILTRPGYASLLDNLQWIPIASICGGVLFAAAGVVTLPYFLMAELLPVKLKSVITTMVLSTSWLFSSLVIEFYHPLVDLLSIAGTIWLFATSCVLEMIFVYFILPETKNLSIELIQAKLR